MSKIIDVWDVWLREPRKAWRNDGGPVPRGMRSRVKRPDNGHSVVIIDRFVDGKLVPIGEAPK